MSHAYTVSLYHCVFSTRNRRPLIRPDIEDRVWAYIGGIARENKMIALQVGGMPDHAHLLLSLPATISVAKAIQLIKGGSSKWIRRELDRLHRFRWQEGYGAFSIGMAQQNTTLRYIQNQKEHHKKKTFKEEFLAFLEAHGVEYDERYIWR